MDVLNSRFDAAVDSTISCGLTIYDERSGVFYVLFLMLCSGRNSQKLRAFCVLAVKSGRILFAYSLDISTSYVLIIDWC